MQIFKKKEQCSGCRACEMTCPQNCISMEMDKEGFLYPKVDGSICLNCQLCKNVCKTIDLKVNLNLKIAYAVKNKENKIREGSSSGGAFYAFAYKIIEAGGAVFGAAYDKNFYVYHRSVENFEDLELLMKSKYVQSDTKSSYKEVKKFLSEKRLCLYVGTPCQIAGLKAYLKVDMNNLICISIICHGVPSQEIWKRYLLFQKGRYGEDTIRYINCREKYWGWRDFSLEIVFDKYKYHKLYTEDLYMKGFMQNLYLRPSCYSCRAKGKIQDADIIIGDYWGIEKYHPELDDGNGVSAVILNTEKGLKLFHAIKDKFEYSVSKYEQILCENEVLEGCVKKNKNREEFYEELYRTGQIDSSIENNIKIEQITNHERYQYQYPFIWEYLKNKIQRNELYILLSELGFYKIALYALTEFAELVYDDLVENSYGVEVVCVTDKRYQNFVNGFRTKKVTGIDELEEKYKNGEIDVVLNCSIFHENEVFNELISRGIGQEHIISIINCIFMLKYVS